jgi:hypothetical protein
MGAARRQMVAHLHGNDVVRQSTIDQGLNLTRSRGFFRIVRIMKVWAPIWAATASLDVRDQ